MAISESQKADLEQKAIPVHSDFDDIIYAIRKDKRGMYIIQSGRELRIAAKNIEQFLSEARQIWELHGKGVQ